MEKMKSTFSMWGERGLIATFFADLNQLAEPETINNFLQNVAFTETPVISSLPPLAIHYIIEPDFGTKGFGSPDAVIALEYQDSLAVIIVEAKLKDFVSACAPRSQRGQKGSKFNSKLNGQLELDYRLAMALSEYRDGATELVEPKWVLSSDYNEDNEERKGKLRRLKNRAVLEDVVSLIGGIPLDRYYFLVITNDGQNPFPCVSDEYLPELFKPESSGRIPSFTNGWSEYRRRFGWLNYVKMRTFIGSIQSRLPQGSLFLQSLSINQRNMKGYSQLRMTEPATVTAQQEKLDVYHLAGKKLSHSGQAVSLIYAPQINPHSFLHFSWKKEGCRLRDYSKSNTEEPLPDRKQTSQVERMIHKEISVPRKTKEKVSVVSFWHQNILEANNAHLKK
jgi:hypothetical protein